MWVFRVHWKPWGLGACQTEQVRPLLTVTAAVARHPREMDDQLPARARPLTIDVFSDIVCPWCLVGNARLERVLAGLEAAGALAEGAAQVRHRPFLLDPATPPEGKDIPAMLRRKYGVEPKALWARLEAEARKSGIELDLSRQPRSYPTIAAHTLVRHAGARGTQRALVRDLFAANFLEARNISDPAVLVEIASRHGFTPAEAAELLDSPSERELTRAEAAEASAQGITGVPFFLINGHLAVSGAQPEEVLRTAVARGLAEI